MWILWWVLQEVWRSGKRREWVSEWVSECGALPTYRVTMNVNVALHWFTAVRHFTGSEHAYRWRQIRGKILIISFITSYCAQCSTYCLQAALIKDVVPLINPPIYHLTIPTKQRSILYAGKEQIRYLGVFCTKVEQIWVLYPGYFNDPLNYFLATHGTSASIAGHSHQRMLHFLLWESSIQRYLLY